MRLPDPHTYGSGNPGATNVLRTGNKLAAGRWFSGDALKGYASLAALAAAVFGPIYFIFLFGFQPMGIALTAVCSLLIWRHRSNIRNLMNGTETRIGSKKTAKESS